MPVIIDQISADVEPVPATRSAEPAAQAAPSAAAEADIQPEDFRRAMLRLVERLARLRAH